MAMPLLQLTHCVVPAKVPALSHTLPWVSLLDFTSRTEKIPKRYGYVLKPSSLVNALRAAGVEIDVQLTRHHSKGLFDVHYWAPSPNAAYERLYITSGTVMVEDLKVIRTKVDNEAIPELVEWISNILSFDPNSPVRRHNQYVELLLSRKTGI